MKKLPVIIIFILYVLTISAYPQSAKAETCTSTVDVDLVVDVSGSITQESLDTFKGAMQQFADTTDDDDRIAVQQFGSEAQRLLGLSDDKEEVRQAIDSVSLQMSGTDFNRSLQSSLNLFQTNDRTAVHAIVFLSDGGDGSWNNTQQTLTTVADRGIIIHTVSVGDIYTTSEDRLIEMASKTGGNYWNAPEEDDLDNLYTTIAQEICVTEENEAKSDDTSESSEPERSLSESKDEPEAPICSDTPPQGSPDLFQIDRNGERATLYFTPLGDPLTYYYISYGLDESAEGYGVEIPGDKDGVLSYTINDLDPNKTYYFKVRGGNGCKPGDWSTSISGTVIPAGMPSTGKLQ